MTAPSTQVDDPVLEDFARDVGADDPVVVAGARTRWSVGGDPDPDARIVRAPEGIVEYRPEEMTVRVRAGTPVAALHDALGARGQRSALPERGGTVGGALAVGENDLGSLGRGRVREAPLQVRYVSAEGRLVTSGGPTVKNVSGFDLPRLMVGALGTLGFLAEVTLRTNPIPATSQWLVATDVDALACHDALVAPSAVLTDGTHTWVHLEGHGPDVAAEAAVLATIGSFEEVEGPPQLPPHRWSLAPRDIPALARGPMRYVASVGVGLVFADEPQRPRSIDPAAAMVAEQLKRSLDPTGRLNPGRDPLAR